jgi:hypothetical protein
MVYQYPFATYTRPSQFYSWGDFSHLRLYLHSHTIRWSNGAELGSAADGWHLRISVLPNLDLIREIRAAGFSGLVIDRAVLKGSQFQELAADLATISGATAREDPDANLVFWSFPRLGYRINYQEDFSFAESITIENRDSLGQGQLSEFIDSDALRAIADREAKAYPQVIRRSDHPEAFIGADKIGRGAGLSRLAADEFQADVSCPSIAEPVNASSNLSVTFEISNGGPYDLYFETGPTPFRLGLLTVTTRDGKQIGDSLVRVPARIRVPSRATVPLTVAIKDLKLDRFSSKERPLIATFALLQEGNIWFGGTGKARCSFSFNPD